MDDVNEIFKLASELIQHTEQSLFLTGKAGTGKTTFLHHIRKNISKNVIVAAPTGVAAVNAGGVTLHSLFQLPFEPYIPDSQIQRISHNFKLHKNKIEMLNRLELLIIDEVSMLRADTLDAIDFSLRHYRRNNQPFGGVQMLYIGDMYQLPPVIKSEEMEIYGKYYESPFFFHAKVIEQAPPLYIELKKIYRQNEQYFIDILNKIRNNETAPADLEFLNQLYNPNFEAPEDKRYIVLSTHNYKADRINDVELDKLPGKAQIFQAQVNGNFQESSYPADFDLRLKEGAQVMFIKNDSGEAQFRRYYNGKLGIVSRLKDGKIFVEPEGSKTEIEVIPDTWTNVRYSLKEETGKIVEEELGAFTQFPLRAAWAITIHKSQGLTFERAVIDAGQAFASGQVYVALSRCTTFNEIALLSKITPASIKTDPEVAEFTKREQAVDELTHILNVERPKYLRKILIKSFEWQLALDLSNSFVNLVADKNQYNRSEDAFKLALSIKTKTLDQHIIAEKFKDQLSALLNRMEQTGDISALKERVQKAAMYFYKDIMENILVPLDSYINDLQKMSKVKQYTRAVKDIRDGFAHLVKQLKDIRYGETVLTENLFPEETVPVKKEQDTTETKSPAPYKPTVQYKPQTKPASATEKSAKPKPEKGSSHRMSLEMLRSGKTIDEIATERNLARATIEGHLASFISTGEISITEIVAEEKIKIITPLVANLTPMSSLAEVKNLLGNDYSYGEIRAVLNYTTGKNEN